MRLCPPLFNVDFALTPFNDVIYTSIIQMYYKALFNVNIEWYLI